MEGEMQQLELTDFEAYFLFRQMSKLLEMPYNKYAKRIYDKLEPMIGEHIRVINSELDFKTEYEYKWIGDKDSES
jgi:hypothetical protein